MAKDFDRDEYMEAHNDGEFMDRPPVTCPVGERDDCPHFVQEGKDSDPNECEWYCNHKDIAEDEHADQVGCPLDWEIEDEDE